MSRQNVGDVYGHAPLPAFFTDPRRACKGAPTNLFFPKGGSNKKAKAICRRCPFRRPCAEWAIDTSAHGVWGATTFDDREAIRKARRANARKGQAK